MVKIIFLYLDIFNFTTGRGAVMKFGSKFVLLLGLLSSSVLASEYPIPLENVEVHETEGPMLSIHNYSNEIVNIDIYGDRFQLKPRVNLMFDCLGYETLELQIMNNFTNSLKYLAHRVWRSLNHFTIKLRKVNNMKKLVIVATILALYGCGGSDSDSSQSTPNNYGSRKNCKITESSSSYADEREQVLGLCWDIGYIDIQSDATILCERNIERYFEKNSIPRQTVAFKISSGYCKS